MSSLGHDAPPFVVRPARTADVRGIQELLGNIRQHAQASQVRLLLDLDTARVRVTVEDNGKGFDPQAVLAGKHKTTGLPGLRERMDLLGGSLQIDSQVGQGTQFTVSFPGLAPSRTESAGSSAG